MTVINIFPQWLIDMLKSRDVVKGKVTQALGYALRAGQPPQPESPTHTRIKDDMDGVTDLWWNQSTAELVVAFQVPDSVLTNASEQPGQPNCLATVRKLKMKEGDVQVDPSLTGVLDSFLNARAFEELRKLHGFTQPRRIICTGFGVGGSVATVAAVILAVDYPLANVRCVTVDSPVVTYGSPAFASLYRFVIALSYHLNTSGLSAFKENAKHSPLYGQFVTEKPFYFYGQISKSQGDLQTKTSDLTAAMQSMEELLSNVMPVIDDSGLVTEKEAAYHGSGESHNLFFDGIDRILGFAAGVKSIFRGMDKEIEPLYKVDATSRKVSLAWNDEPGTAPFSKPLDRVEKLLLVKNRVAALAGMNAVAHKDKDDFLAVTGVEEKSYAFVDRKSGLDGQCHIVWRPAINTLIVAFRGSTSLKDFLVDAAALQTSLLGSIVKGALVHQGFLGQLLDIFPEIQEKIKCLRKKPGADASVEHIITTGHSLGGALATVVGPLFAKEFPGADVSVISSGAPRVGNEEFCQAFATVIGSSMRLQYNLDAVPCVPSRIIKTPPIRYAHVAGNAYLLPGSSRGNMLSSVSDGFDEGALLDLYADPPQELEQCVKKAVGNQRERVGEVVADHGPQKPYVGALVGYMRHLVKEEDVHIGTSTE